MVVTGKAGLYHFAGVLVQVPESGEAEVSEEVGKAMVAAGFAEKKQRGRPKSEPDQE